MSSVTINSRETFDLPVTSYLTGNPVSIHADDTISIAVNMTSKDPNENNEDSGKEPLIIFVAGDSSPAFTLNQWNYKYALSYTATSDNPQFKAFIEGQDDDETATVDIYQKPSFGITPIRKVGMGAAGIVVATVGAGITAADLYFNPEPNTKAFLAKVGVVVTLTGIGLTAAALDPPDPNYRLADNPVTPTSDALTAGGAVTQQLANAGNALLSNLYQSIGLSRVILTAENRESGAMLQGDTPWANYHRQVVEYYTPQLGALLNAQRQLFANFQSAMQAAGIDTTLTADQISALESNLASNGLPSSITTLLNQLGADTDTVNQITGLLITQDPTELAGDEVARTTDAKLVDALFNTASSLGGANPQPANLAAVATGFTHSAEDYTNFINAAYQRYLGRAPDAGGLAFWLYGMQQGLVTDERLEAGFIGSQEYINNHGGAGAAWVTGMYRDLLGRTPQPDEVAYWVNNLNHGMSTAAVAYGFAASREREGQRVAQDYQVYLGRSADAAGQAYWVNLFLSGATNEDVVAGFMGSAEYYQNANKGNAHWIDWIGSLYLDMLHRNASADEITYWTGILHL
jgi:hypothetical protein